MATAEACLFLADWESVRTRAHAGRRQRAEATLCSLQLRAQGGAAAVEGWLAVFETRRKLEEIGASASARAVEELETRWRPQRLETCDGAAAAWLLASERANSTALAARAACWARALPEGAAELRRRHQQFVESLLPTASSSAPSGLIARVRAWDQDHAAAEHAWRIHDERLQAAASAAGTATEEQVPPDIWLSEVRYREQARAHLGSMVAAEAELCAAAIALETLDVDRSRFWNVLAAAYASTHDAFASGGGASTAGPEAGLQAEPPPIRRADAGLPECPADEQVPEMPSASGAVLHRARVSLPVEKGRFGFGGGGWQGGCTLVLTLHGYLHVFAAAAQSAGAEAATKTGVAEAGAEAGKEGEELVESDIKASVYVPMATRCVFLRKGGDYIMDLAEAELPNAEKEQGGFGGGIRRLFGRDGAKAVQRRVNALVADEAVFTALERRCHDFVRRGQGLRSVAPAAETEAAAR